MLLKICQKNKDANWPLTELSIRITGSGCSSWENKMITVKQEIREAAEEIEIPNQRSILTFGEKENFKYMGILEADNTN